MAHDRIEHSHHDLIPWHREKDTYWFSTPSDHQPDVYHETSVSLETGETSCTCDGYRFRQSCWHTQKAALATRYHLARKQLKRADDERLMALVSRMLTTLFKEGPIEFWTEERIAFAEAIKDELAARQQGKERRTA